MGHTLLIAGVLTLFSWAVAMMVMTIGLAVYTRASRQRTARAIDYARAPVEAFVLKGRPLRPAKGRLGEAQTELLLRYTALLRGHEAARISEYLEREGYVAEAVKRLQARRRWRRAEAAALLGRMRSRLAVAPLVLTLRTDRSEDVRSIAARSLAVIGDPSAVQALSEALADPSRWTASAVAGDLAEMGAPAVPALLTIAESGANRAALNAVRILGEIRDLRAGPVLLQILHGQADLNLRAQAAAALGKIGGAQTVPALRAALHDPEWQVRAQAANALGALGDPSSAGDLAVAMVDTSWWVRQNCAEALIRLGEAGQAELGRLAESSDRYVRERALAALERLSDPGGRCEPAATAPIDSSSLADSPDRTDSDELSPTHA